MKIGIFSDTYHPDINGVVTSIKMMERELISRGHEVHIFAPSKHEVAENENLYMLKSIPLFVKKYNYRIATFYSRPLAKEIRDLNLDIVHTHDEFSLGLFAKIISRKYNIPLVHTYHTLWEDYVHYIFPVVGPKNIFPKRFARNFTKNFMSKTDAVICPSKKTEKYLKYRCKIKNKQMYIVPTGIDITPFNPNNFTTEMKTNLKNELGLKEEDFILLYVGRIAEEKSVDVIINSMPSILEKIPNAKLVVVGDGPTANSLKNRAKELNISDYVIFTGRQPWENISLYYSIGDVFLNASTTETQGLTFVEAMAAGIPIIAKYDTNLDGLIVNKENGLFFKHNEELTKTVISLYEDSNLREKFRKNGFETAKKYSIKTFGDDLEFVYKEAIKAHSEKEKKHILKAKNLLLLKRK